jgi:hypothetical protein
VDSVNGACVFDLEKLLQQPGLCVLIWGERDNMRMFYVCISCSCSVHCTIDLPEPVATYEQVPSITLKKMPSNSQENKQISLTILIAHQETSSIFLAGGRGGVAAR